MTTALSYLNTYGIKEKNAIDMTLSENPLGCSRKVHFALKKYLNKLHQYPGDLELQLRQKLASKFDIPEEMVHVGDAANGLLEDVIKIFGQGKNIVCPMASFPEPIYAVSSFGGTCTLIPLDTNFSINLDALANNIKENTALIYLCNPNNPTGIYINSEKILDFAAKIKCKLLVSEASVEFVQGKTLINKEIPKNLIIVRSFSKAYGLAGLRSGYLIAAPEIIYELKCNTRSYKLSGAAAVASMAALEDDKFLQKSLTYIEKEKTYLINEMLRLGFVVLPSDAQNFIAKLPEKFINATEFTNAAKLRGIAVVDCTRYGLERYIRVSPQQHKINKKYINALNQIIRGK